MLQRSGLSINYSLFGQFTYEAKRWPQYIRNSMTIVDSNIKAINCED